MSNPLDFHDFPEPAPAFRGRNYPNPTQDTADVARLWRPARTALNEVPVATLARVSKFLVDEDGNARSAEDLDSGYAGIIAAGPPSVGTYLAGDWVHSQSDGVKWFCAVAGSPGTWVSESGDRTPADPQTAVFAALLQTAGYTLSNLQKAQITAATASLRESGGWTKLREIWIPFGTSLTQALVKFKSPLGAQTSMVNDNLVSGDYTQAGGIYTAGGSGKRLRSDFTPSTAVPAITTNSQCIGIYSLTSSWTGVLGGTTSSGTYVLYENGGSTIGGNGASLAAILGRGLKWIQNNGANTEAGQYGFIGYSASGTAATPTGAVSILSNNGSNYGTAAIGGYFYSDALTSVELAAVGLFFDRMNFIAGRTARNAVDLNTVGDSIVRGYLVTSAQRWSKLVADSLVLTEKNEGTDGEAMSSTASGAPSYYSGSKIKNKTSTISASKTIISYGINDVITGVTAAQFETDYEAALTQLLNFGGYAPGDLMLCTPAWVNLADGYSSYTKARHAQFADIVSKLGAKYKIRVCDLYRGRIYGQASAIDADNIHPIAAGHALIAQDVLDALNY